MQKIVGRGYRGAWFVKWCKASSKLRTSRFYSDFLAPKNDYTYSGAEKWPAVKMQNKRLKV